MIDDTYQLLPPLTEDERINLKEDIRRKGVLVPIEFDEDGNVLDGHHRLAAVRELEAEGFKIQYDSIIRRGLSEDQKIDHVLTLNLKRRHLSHETRAQIFGLMRANGATLQAISDASGVSTATVWRVLEDTDSAPAFTKGKDGKLYPAQYLKRQLVSVEDVQRKEKRELTDEPAPAPPKSPVTKPGDIWTLGGHRVVCGSSFNTSILQALVGSEKPILLVTSPPYWVGKEYEQESMEDEIEEHIALAANAWNTTISKAGRIVINTMAVNGGHRNGQKGEVVEIDLLLNRWQNALRREGWYMRGVRIWAKEGGFIPMSAPSADIHSMRWEFLATFYYPGPRREPNRVNAQWAMEGLWKVNGEQSNPDHPAVFPPEIPGRFIELYSDDEDVIFDPYLGSGSTLIAAEKLGRRCYGVELSPAYCDVIIERWQNLTGGKAVRGPANDGG